MDIRTLCVLVCLLPLMACGTVTQDEPFTSKVKTPQTCAGVEDQLEKQHQRLASYVNKIMNDPVTLSAATSQKCPEVVDGVVVLSRKVDSIGTAIESLEVEVSGLRKWAEDNGCPVDTQLYAQRQQDYFARKRADIAKMSPSPFMLLWFRTHAFFGGKC